jgi:3-hydroxybutyrate dehydrogenase
MSFDFTGRRVLVTGASRGIGYGIARAFARNRADLTIIADDAAVSEAGERLSAESGNKVAATVCDVTDRAAVARVVGGLGPLDVLVNNAGVEQITPVLDPGEEIDRTFMRILDVNVNGSWHVTRAAVAGMRAGARIIFTSSVWGKTGEAEFGGYCASKHAIIGLMRALARELGPRGINVNAVCPGWVRTDASLRSLGDISRRADRQPPDVLAEVLSGQALGGLMEPDDVAELYLFLASEHARNMTGQAVNVDRGEGMW